MTVKSFRNIQLPLGDLASNADQPLPQLDASHPFEPAFRGSKLRKGIAAGISLPVVDSLPLGNDETAAERDELLGVSAEAYAHAKLAMQVFEADRICSWLSSPQRHALRANLRLLNILSIEAHMRASGLFPTQPVSLPFYRMVAYLMVWRAISPYYLRRLGLAELLPQMPPACRLDSCMPSRSLRAEAFTDSKDLFAED